MIYLNCIVKLEVTNDSSPSRSSSIRGPTVQTRGDIDAQVKQGDMGGNPTFWLENWRNLDLLLMTYWCLLVFFRE